MPQLRKIVALAMLLVIAVLPDSAWATINGTCQWNVRSDGSDNNGGFFDPSVTSPGTDYSQQAAPQVSYTDIVIGATTTQFTSASFPALAAYVGNGLQITGGTGCTTGFYEVMSQSSGTYTVDRALGTAASTCTGYLGGALATPATAAAGLAANNLVHVKSATYTFTSTLTIAVTSDWIGYTSTFYDGAPTKPVFTTATNSVPLIHLGGSQTTKFYHLSFTSTAATKAVGIYSSAHNGNLYIQDCYASGFGGGTDAGAFIDNGNGTNYDWSILDVEACELTGNVTAIWGSTNNLTGQLWVIGNYFHGNGVDLRMGGGSVLVAGNVFSSNTGGATSYDIEHDASCAWFANNTVYGTTGTALFNDSGHECIYLRNNVFYGNYKALAFSGTVTDVSDWKNNAYGNNTNANTTFSGSLWNPSDITLTASPFTNAAGGDFSPNSTTGGGALLVGQGWQPSYGSSTVNKLNIGAVQSSASGSSGGTVLMPQGFSY